MVKRSRALGLKIAAIVIASMAVLSACNDDGSAGEDRITFTYVNNTGTLICEYHGTAASPEGLATGCEIRIEPNTTSESTRECFSIEAGASDIVLIKDESGDVIYARTANCRDWLDAGLTITIDNDGDEFIVTDGFAP